MRYYLNVLPSVLFAVLALTAPAQSQNKTGSKPSPSKAISKGKPLDIRMHANGGKGGAGIKRDGQYLVFGESRLHLTQLELEKVPGAELFERAILNLDLTDQVKGMLLSAGLNGLKRKFYEIDDISQAERERLLEIYRKQVRLLPGDELPLFAVTDVEARETFLLPEFRELRGEMRKATILFHESLWLVKPLGSIFEESRVTYKQVVSAEVAFTHYLQRFEQGDRTYFPLDLYRELSRILHCDTLPFAAALTFDARFGYFQSYSSVASSSLGIISRRDVYLIDAADILDAASVGYENERYFDLSSLDRWGLRTNSNPAEASESSLVAFGARMKSQYPKMATYQVLQLGGSVCFIGGDSVEVDDRTRMSFYKQRTTVNSILNTVYRPYFIFDTKTQAIMTSDRNCILVGKVQYLKN